MRRIFTYTILFLFVACSVTAISAQKVAKAATTKVTLYGDDDINKVATVFNTYDGKTITVQVYRSLYGNSWATFCSPFTIPVANFDAGSPSIKMVDKVAEFVGYENGVLKFQTGVTTLQAGVPYLIYNNSNAEGIQYFNIENLTINKADFSSTPKDAVGGIFQGTYTTVTNNDASNNWWYLSNVTSKKPYVQYFKKLKEGGQIKGFRAYFKMPTGSDGASRLGMSVDGDLTGIEGVKIAVDGKIVDNRIYSLDGACMGYSEKGLPRGVYVRNGIKFTVK